MARDSLEQLIRQLARLPGLGPRSARRAALYLMRHRDSLMLPLADSMGQIGHNVRNCSTCGNLDMADLCHICRDETRDQSRLCIVESVADLWAIERVGIFPGRYHVLGGVLSAIDGVDPKTLRLDYLVERTQDEAISEVILAMSATVDGQATAHYIADKLSRTEVLVTRLAHGVPVGGTPEYLDDGTLTQAIKSRQKLL